MASLNRLNLIGNVGKDGELKYSASGTAMLQFSLAVADRRKNNKTGEWEENTDWFNVTVFGDSAERIAQYVTKGKSVYVEGRVKLREYTDKNNENRASLDVAAREIVLLGSRDDDGQQQRRQGGRQQQQKRRQNEDYEDLPYE